MESESLFTKCKTCGKAVSKSASTCPHCGAKQVRVNGTHLAVSILVGLIFLGMIASPNNSNTPTSPPSSGTLPKASTSQEQAPLELLSWSCQQEHGYVHVRGEVRNTSSRKLENVVAVGEFRTKDGELVKAEEALLDYNPILPSQTSPFSAGGTDNPRIKHCGVTFKYLLGGSIDFAEKKKQPK